MPMTKLVPEVMQLKRDGLTVKQIAARFNKSERYVYKILAHGKEGSSNMTVVLPDPKSKEEMELEIQARLEFTPEGFEKFFNAYSGRELQPIHKKWVQNALSTTRTLINCPPRHAKSTIFSVWFPIWLVCMDRDVQILICSQTEQLAKKFTNEIANAFSHNEDMIKDFGRFRPEMADRPWRPNQGQLMVEGRRRAVKSGDLTIQVRGAEQQILGMEANWVIVDDAVSRKNAATEGTREKLSTWFHGDVMSRLEPGSRAICIGQRLHLYDLYGELSQETVKDDKGEEKPRWNHINYPAILTWPDDENPSEVLWPEKWTFEALQEVYADTGSDLFEAMYQQNPLAEGDALARRAWIYADGDDHPGCLDMLRPAYIPAQQETGIRTARVMSLDPSPTKYAGLIVADIFHNPNYFDCRIIEITREKMRVRDMIQHLERVVETYEPDYFVFEQNAAQRWLLQDESIDRLKRRVRIVPHNTGKNKGDPALGVESLSMDFEFGRIRMPYGDAEARSMSELLIQEALTYPQGLTDDLLMALWFIKFNYSRLVPPYLNGEETKRARGWRVPPRLSKGWGWLANG